MSPLFVLAKQRVLDVMRDRASASFYFLLPVAILGVLALVFERGHPFEQKALALVTERAESATLQRALRALPELRVTRDPTEAAALGKLRARAVNVVLIEGHDGRRRLLSGTNDRLLALGIASALQLAAEVDVVALPRFGYLHFLFPGLITSLVMFAGLFGMGYAMVRFRQNLFLKKLATTRLSKSTFVAAQLLGRGLLVSVQVALLVGSLVLGFGMPVTLSGALAIGLLSTLGLLVFSGLGFGLAALIENDAVMTDIINSVTLPVVLLSGVFFGTEALPAWLGAVSRVLPSTLMVDALRATVLYGSPLAGQWREIVGLAVWVLASFGFSVGFFRWHR